MKSREWRMGKGGSKMRPVSRGDWVKEVMVILVVVVVTLLLTQERKQYVLKKMVQKTGKIAIFMRKRGQKHHKYFSSINNKDSSYICSLIHFLITIINGSYCNHKNLQTYPTESPVNALHGLDCLCCPGK